MHQVYIVNPGKIQALITRCRPTASPITRVYTLSVGNNHLDPVQLKLPILMPCDCWPKVWATLATKHDAVLLNPSSTPPVLFHNFPRPLRWNREAKDWIVVEDRPDPVAIDLQHHQASRGRQAGIFRCEQCAGKTAATLIQSRGSDAARRRWRSVVTPTLHVHAAWPDSGSWIYSREMPSDGRQMKKGPQECRSAQGPRLHCEQSFLLVPIDVT